MEGDREAERWRKDGNQLRASVFSCSLVCSASVMALTWCSKFKIKGFQFSVLILPPFPIAVGESLGCANVQTNARLLLSHTGKICGYQSAWPSSGGIWASRKRLEGCSISKANSAILDAPSTTVRRSGCLFLSLRRYACYRPHGWAFQHGCAWGRRTQL